LNPNEIRFSQDSVSYLKQRPGQASYTLDDLVNGMRTQGWKGDPVDVVRLPDGTFSSIDNTRILAAREAGIDVQANVRAYNERLPDSMLDRFEHPKVPGGYAQTWGEALEYRILRQNKTFQKNNYPVGSYQDPKVKYNVKDWFNLD